MIGSPLETPTWNDVTGPIYNAATTVAEGAQAPLWYATSEGIWLIISIAICIFALLLGHGHEAGAYRRERDRARGASRDY